MATNLSDYYTFEHFLARNRERFTEYQVRWLLRFAGENGLLAAGAVTKVGARWYINEQKFAEWMASSRPQMQAAG